MDSDIHFPMKDTLDRHPFLLLHIVHYEAPLEFWPQQVPPIEQC